MFLENDPGRFVQVFYRELRPAMTAVYPLGLAAVVHQDGAASGALARFDVVQRVTDHPRLRQVQVMQLRGPKQQTRRRLPASTLDPIGSHDAFGVMGAVM